MAAVKAAHYPCSTAPTPSTGRAGIRIPTLLIALTLAPLAMLAVAVFLGRSRLGLAVPEQRLDRVAGGRVAALRVDGDRGWVTISAATGEGASQEALAQAAAINAKAAPWAFALTELDWGGFSTPLSALVD